jgi:hypothetical protein
MMKKCCKLFFHKHINLELCREDFLWVVKELRKREAEQDGNRDVTDADPTVADCQSLFNYIVQNPELPIQEDVDFDDFYRLLKLLSASLHKNPELLIVQNVYHFAHFVYIACTLSSASGWQRYQELFARWLNSGSGMNAIVNLFFSNRLSIPVALMILSEKYYPSEDQNRLQFFFSWIIWAAVALMNTFAIFLIDTTLLTHAIPMLFAYIWVVMIFLVLCNVCYRIGGITKLLPSPVQNPAQILPWYSPAWFLLSSFAHVMVIGFGTVFLITLFNYGLLLYSFPAPVSPSQYMSVIVTEYNARNTYCWLGVYANYLVEVERFAGISHGPAFSFFSYFV